MVSLTIEGENLAAVLTQVRDAFSRDAASTIAPSGENRKEARVKTEKDKETAKADESGKTSAPAAKAAAGQASFLAVAEIIPKVVASAGKPKAVELLAKYGAKKGGELKPEQYASFLADAKTALGE